MPIGPSAPFPKADERPAPDPAAMPDLAAKVRCLRDPTTYGVPESPVEAIETHMAWVFLVGPHAYKLKKPVLREMLDYRTIEDRLRICRDEVRLNRRLAPRAYLGVVPLTWSTQGFSLGGDGVIVDWLVHMRCLPRERTLDRLLAEGTLRVEDVDRVARLLAEFYRSAPPVPFTPDGYRERFRLGVENTARVLLSNPAFTLPPDLVADAAGGLESFLTEATSILLDERAEAGRVIEAHGDLRPEHIFLVSEPVVIDCLEFDRDLRLLDPAEELSFLAVECSLLGQPWVGERFRRIYSEVTGDWPERPLLQFYEAYRAFLRAKIAIWHLADDGIHDHERWRARATRYLGVVLDAFPRRGR